MTTFFISDTHFNHNKIIQYCKRPFKNALEMNERIIEEWNKVVKENDLVYHLGDIGWGNMTPILKRLKGKKFLIIGNHDKSLNRAALEQLVGNEYLKEINIDGQTIVMCHYSLQVWNKSHVGSWHLFGHSHGSLKGVGKSMDVGVDATQLWRPISFEEVRERLTF